VSRGEIWRVEFDPVVGREPNKARPALIVGRTSLTKYAMSAGTTVTVVPLTRNVSKVFAFQVLVPAGTGGLAWDSKAQAEQIRTISTKRLVEQLGAVNEEVSASVDEAIRVYLGL